MCHLIKCLLHRFLMAWSSLSSDVCTLLSQKKAELGGMLADYEQLQRLEEQEDQNQLLGAEKAKLRNQLQQLEEQWAMCTVCMHMYNTGHKPVWGWDKCVVRNELTKTEQDDWSIESAKKIM